MIKKQSNSFLFLALLVIVSLFYNYQEIILKKPQSIHKWRQSDCASITLNYYQGGMNFLNPETNNLTSDGGTTGNCCTSETPILYYTVACFYKIFGHHDYIYRIFNTLLFFAGLFFLYRLLHYILKDTFWAISIALLFFTSPLLVFYGNNFLTNSSALAFSIIGWYYFLRFTYEARKRLFYLSMVCFFIAAALKITSLFSLIAIVGLYLVELFNLKAFDKGTKLFKQPVLFVIPILSVFIVNGIWLLYAHNYNQKHDSSYFSTTIFPIWDLDKESIRAVMENIKNLWLAQYFHKSVLVLFLCSFIFISFKRNNQLLIYGILFIFIEVIAYILLQFWTFADHDYYTIDIYILPILIMINAFDILKRCYTKVFNSLISKTVFAIFLLFNIYYAHAKMDERYNGWMNDYPKNEDLYTITPYLRQIGLTPNDTVISIPDGGHSSLYLMNQKGWTEYVDAHFNKGIPTIYNQDSAGIQASINRGAKYLIVNGIEELYKKKYLQYYCKNLIGRYNNVLIFQLKTKVVNFNLQQQKLKAKYICDAETVTDNKQSFMNRNDRVLFDFGTTQSNTFAHEGKYSCKLDVISQYGMTIKCKNVKYGESFVISVWRKPNTNAKGDLIISSDDYYNGEYKVIETGLNGWEKIYKEIFISPQLDGKDLSIYLYNPDKEPVYFDDLEIIRYEGVSDMLKSERH